MMEATFFHRVQRFQRFETSSGPVTVPILYPDVHSMWVYFSAPIHKVRALLPTDRLKPISMGNGNALYGIVCFEYRDTTIGSYNEVGIGVPCRLDPSINIPILPALFHRFFSVGFYVHHLPVTTQIAYDAGVEIWGLPKFVAQITFEETGTWRRCMLEADGQEILTLEVTYVLRNLQLETYDFQTFSVKDKHVLKIPVQSQGHVWTSRKAECARLHLGDHPLSEELRSLQLNTKPLKTIIYPNMQVILYPASDRYAL